MPSRRMLLVGMLASGSLGLVGPAHAGTFGRFDGKFKGRFVRGGVAVLEASLSFVDPNGRRWTAPKGTTVNGASIPRPLWSIVGSPFTGDYLRASVIHDHYCVTTERSWRDTHLTFWYGCRADGLSKLYSDLLYAGVYRFGPRWSRKRGLTGATVTKRFDPEFDHKEFDELQRWIKTNNPSLDDLRDRLE